MVWLMFHDVIDQSCEKTGFADEEYRLSDVAFERIVAFFAHNPDVAFTFDDGGVSSYTVAAPILEKYGKRGFFFVPTAYIGREGFLSSSQIVDLRNRGHVIGSHSHSHSENMTLLTEQQIYEEWALSSKILRNILNEDIIYASIPNGYSSSIIYKAVVSSGVKNILTSRPDLKAKELICGDGKCNVCGRYAIKKETSTVDITRFITSKLFRTRILIKWDALCVLKTVLGKRYEFVKSIIFGK